MTSQIVPHEIAVQRAKVWLQGLAVATPEAKALRNLGILCCKRLQAGLGLHDTSGSKDLRLPGLAGLVTMDREQVLELCRTISQASVKARRRAALDRHTWGEIFGGLALSHARAGDPSTAARLLRAAAQLELEHHWLREGETFLLDQQTPEGSFGLFARELALIGSEQECSMAKLNFSVEVLWALAEFQALRNSVARRDVRRSNTRDKRSRRPIRAKAVRGKRSKPNS